MGLADRVPVRRAPSTFPKSLTRYRKPFVMDLQRRPSDQECFDYHRDYVAKVGDGNILDTLTAQALDAPDFIRRIPTDQWTVVHPPYGWKVCTVIEHCCDAERVFGYRILRFATGDATELPGWDENFYAASGYSRPASMAALAEEFSFLRQSNLRLLERLADASWDRIGVAEGRRTSVRTLAWLMAGHWLHHRAILALRLGWDA